MIELNNEGQQVENVEVKETSINILISIPKQEERYLLEQEYLKLLDQQNISSEKLEEAYSNLLKKYPHLSEVAFSVLSINSDHKLSSFHSGGHHLFLLRGGMLIRLNKKDNSSVSLLLQQKDIFEEYSECLSDVKLMNKDILLLCGNDFLQHIDTFYFQKLMVLPKTLEEKKGLIAEILTKDESEETVFTLLDVQGNPTKKVTALQEKKKENEFLSLIKNREFLSFGGMVAFVLLILSFHLYTFSGLDSQLSTAQDKNKLLLADLEEKVESLEILVEDEKLGKEWLISRTFDRLDEEKCRLYALYRDENENITATEIAFLFNVPKETIKSIPVGGESWFIVPVKGVHFVKRGDTFKKVAKLYYEDPVKAAILLQKFNSSWQIGKYAFLPFDATSKN